MPHPLVIGRQSFLGLTWTTKNRSLIEPVLDIVGLKLNCFLWGRDRLVVLLEIPQGHTSIALDIHDAGMYDY